jgi:hypothetical protein
MEKITRAQVKDLFLPGRVVSVEYLKKDLTADLIDLAHRGGRATHALCCMGGLDIVEATAFGVSETNLHNYLRGNCRLTVRETRPAPSEEQAELATDFWDKRVLDPYDWGMILGTIPIAIARHVIGFFSRRLGDKLTQKMPNLLASSSLSTCAELAARGVRQFNLKAFAKYGDAAKIDPEILRTDNSLRTVVILNGALLEG